MPDHQEAKEYIHFQYINTRLATNLNIIAFGYQKCSITAPEIGPTKRNFNCIHYVLKGKGFLTVGSKKYALREKDLFFFPANETIWYYPDKEDPWEYIWISFAGPDAKSLCAAVGLTAQQPVYHVSSDKPEACMKGLLLLKPNAPSLEFSGQSILYGLFAALTDERRLSPPTKDIYREGYVFKAISYIEQHYTDPSLHLSQISRHLNISSSYLSAVFKSQTGQTVMNYIISMRMAKACQMLEEGHNTIQNISSLVGFSDSHYFSKFFKKYVGISPSKYKAHVNTQT